MHPYKYKKLTSCPDVADCQIEGRNFSAGGKNYCNPKNKASSRRYIKRSDKNKIDKETIKDIENE